MEEKKKKIAPVTNITPEKKKKAKAFNQKIGNKTYRQLLLRLNKWRKTTNQNEVVIEIKELSPYLETWLVFGTNRVLLEDTLQERERALQSVTSLRRYLLDREYNVLIKED